MKLKVRKLGIVVVDKATELSGMLTHWVVGMGKSVRYIFQPKGLDEGGQPVDRIFLDEERLEIHHEDGFETVEVPFEILGSVVTDEASGFTGMAVEFVYHVNGCFHVVIQPKGFSSKTGAAIRMGEFDLRLCTGPMITELSERELKKSRKERPSPMAGVVRDDLPSSGSLGHLHFR